MILFLKKHYLALVLALIVGAVSVAPEFLYVRHLGSDYLGMPFLPTANEEIYLTKIHEVIEGHWRVGSPVFFEYKNNYPLVPPVGEYFYALPSLILSISLVKVVVFSKFLLPALLFLLVYFFIYCLTLNKAELSGKINALTGGLFVVLGFDLIDYSSVWRYLNGASIQNFVVWTRPVNPIFGALLIFILLILLWRMITGRKKYLFIPAGFTLALMVGYFFSWGMSLSVIGAMTILALHRKDFYLVKQLILTLATAFAVSLPYWYNLFFSLVKSGDGDLAAKNGMFYTRAPMINKALLAISLIFILLTAYKIWKKENLQAEGNNWWWFSLALIFGGWLAYNQQIITGRTIWPYHFSQYSIPFVIAVGMLILGNFFRLKFFKIWAAAIALILLSITAYNVKAFVDYPKRYEAARFEQTYAGAVDWLNNNAPRECVVLINEPTGYAGFRITALTNCDMYSAEWVYEKTPAERIYHNYLVSLKLKGVTQKNINDYFLDEENSQRMKMLFFENWQESYSLTSDQWLKDKISQITADYKEFYKKDFYRELKKYRLDYIINQGELSADIKKQLPNIKSEAVYDDFYIYSLK